MHRFNFVLIPSNVYTELQSCFICCLGSLWEQIISNIQIASLKFAITPTYQQCLLLILWWCIVQICRFFIHHLFFIVTIIDVFCCYHAAKYVSCVGFYLYILILYINYAFQCGNGPWCNWNFIFSVSLSLSHMLFLSLLSFQLLSSLHMQLIITKFI